MTAGYSVSHRALSASYADRLLGLWNIVIVRRADNTLRKLLGQRWFRYKQKVAFRNADRAVTRMETGRQESQLTSQTFSNQIDRIHNAYES